MKTTALIRAARARRSTTTNTELRLTRRASHAPTRRAPRQLVARWTLSGGRVVLAWQPAVAAPTNERKQASNA